MRHVYIVVVQAECALPKVSHEAYSTLIGAQNFIEHRGDGPEKLTDFHYISNRYEYIIHELALR